ncbi:MAG: DNA-binding protein [bacterium]|nr:DNA-binding protein [bacterium]
MATITITLSQDQHTKLKELAERFQISPEDMARASLEELLSDPDEVFQNAANHVLHKNAELYQRLA